MQWIRNNYVCMHVHSDNNLNWLNFTVQRVRVTQSYDKSAFTFRVRCDCRQKPGRGGHFRLPNFTTIVVVRFVRLAIPHGAPSRMIPPLPTEHGVCSAEIAGQPHVHTYMGNRLAYPFAEAAICVRHAEYYYGVRTATPL